MPPLHYFHFPSLPLFRSNRDSRASSHYVSRIIAVFTRVGAAGFSTIFFDHSSIFAPALLDVQHLDDSTDKLDFHLDGLVEGFQPTLSFFPDFGFRTLATSQLARPSSPQRLCFLTWGSFHILFIPRDVSNLTLATYV